MHAFTEDRLDLESLRARLRTMGDIALRSFGKAAAFLCRPEQCHLWPALHRRSKVSAEFAQDLLTNAKVVFAIYTFVVYLAAMKLAVSLLAFVAVAFSATIVP